MLFQCAVARTSPLHLQTFPFAHAVLFAVFQSDLLHIERRMTVAFSHGSPPTGVGHGVGDGVGGAGVGDGVGGAGVGMGVGHNVVSPGHTPTDKP